MRNIKCDEILDRSEFLKLSISDFEEQVKRYCISKMNEYETEPSKVDSLKFYPEKKYEIFKLLFEDGKAKIFILDTNSINYKEDLEERELYYSRIIAKRICDNMKILEEDAIIGISESELEYKEDIDNIKSKIKELKELDENEYNLDRFAHNALKDTKFFEKIEEGKDEISEENRNLKEKLKSSEKQILELSNKLKISLDTIEKNREDLQLHTTSKFEKVINYVKKILE